MKPGDLVRVPYRRLIFATMSGGHCVGEIAAGEIVMIIEVYDRRNKVKILHPVHGPGFILRRGEEEVIDETR